MDYTYKCISYIYCQLSKIHIGLTPRPCRRAARCMAAEWRHRKRSAAAPGREGRRLERGTWRRRCQASIIPSLTIQPLTPFRFSGTCSPNWRSMMPSVSSSSSSLRKAGPALPPCLKSPQRGSFCWPILLAHRNWLCFSKPCPSSSAPDPAPPSRFSARRFFLAPACSAQTLSD